MNFCRILTLRVGTVGQAVRRSPPFAGVPSSRLVTPCGFRGARFGYWLDFSRGFFCFRLPQISFHNFSTLILLISFHFFCPCDGTTGVVGRHLCYAQIFKVETSLHFFSRPGAMLGTSWGDFFLLTILSRRAPISLFPILQLTVLRSRHIIPFGNHLGLEFYILRITVGQLVLLLLF